MRGHDHQIDRQPAEPDRDRLSRPSATAAPTTQPSAHSVTTSAPSIVSATPSASSATSLLWLWILLGVLVVAGLIALVARSARRRSAAAAGWRSRLIDAYAKARLCMMR
jgi:hypothetical protein